MTRQVYVPNFDVYLNDSKLSNDLKSRISSVTINDDLDAPSSFNFNFDTVDLKLGKWVGLDLDVFDIGDKVDIYLGMDQTKEVFSGKIDSLSASFGDQSSLTVSGFSWLHALTFGTQTQVYQDTTDSDIAQTVARRNNLSAETDSTSTRYQQVTQNNQSDLQFLLARAKRIGYDVAATEKSLIFKKSQEGDAPVATLQFGIQLDDFSATVNNLDQGSSVEVRGWDMMKKQQFAGSASSGDEDSKMGKNEAGFSLASQSSATVIQTSDPVDLNNANTIAKDKYNERLLGFITGQGSCLGNNNMTAGKTVEIKGVGSKFSGTYYLSSVTHTLNSQGYSTSFSVKKTAI
ncbi:phage late control D family protein [Celerinatantimonas diazotrophica]|uniref:Phage protein D n=1 Tax=Celerinatantimonas diazotrophica TaxID=412034 RepID=A0A4R1J9U4_9GAMM|nr:contractile injection system protein, VgrG/Pvc8 family [Celerinatantimonas diazotrophica]TCK47368.1 phage protein D [Celerinatantimonas diazotrophica]CAG9295014.1 hypothetical protein CEDIAZO_00120 [Celerinatantimonas diazotrophica]